MVPRLQVRVMNNLGIVGTGERSQEIHMSKSIFFMENGSTNPESVPAQKTVIGIVRKE